VANKLDLPVKTIAMIALSLIVVAGVALVVYSQFDVAGGGFEDKGDQAGSHTDCILNKKDNAEDCKEEQLQDNSFSEVSKYESIPV